MKHTVVTETSTARDFLTRAIKTMNDRGKRYDSPDGERSMGHLAVSAITTRHIADYLATLASTPH